MPPEKTALVAIVIVSTAAEKSSHADVSKFDDGKTWRFLRDNRHDVT